MSDGWARSKLAAIIDFDVGRKNGHVGGAHLRTRLCYSAATVPARVHVGILAGAYVNTVAVSFTARD